MIKELGRGAYATVKLCVDKNTRENYAIKIMNKDKLRKIQQGKGRNAYDCVMDELRVMERLEHPNIIWLHEIIDDPNTPDLYLVTEYHCRGSLGDQLKQINKYRSHKLRKGLNLARVRLYLIDILKALHYCHKVIKVIHRDIKPDNIMVNHNEEAVLIDFGISALVDQQDDDTLKSVIGTQYYQAPEMFKSRDEKEKPIRGELTDIWALGITLFELVTGSTPYSHIKNPFELKEEILERPIAFSKIKNRVVRECIEMLLQKDPQQRASLQDIQNCAWITRNGREAVDIEMTDNFDMRKARNDGHS